MAVITVTGKAFLPEWVWIIEVPERAEDIAKRWHNKYAKEALREVIERYHSSPKGFRRHFERSARTRYRHFPRDPKYKRIKQKHYGSTVDLVKRGRTKKRMLREYILRTGGSATGGNLSATLILRFPFKGGTGRFRNESDRRGVTIQKMIIELQRFADEDPAMLAEWYKAAYMKRVDNHRSTRKRIRIS